MTKTRSQTGSLSRPKSSLSPAQAASLHRKRPTVPRQSHSSMTAQRSQYNQTKFGSLELPNDRTRFRFLDLPKHDPVQLTLFRLLEHNQMQSTLFCLPAELRELIYSFALVLEDEKAISYYVNMYQNRRRFTGGNFERGKEWKVAKAEYLYQKLGLGLLGPVCQRIYLETRPIFWGRNHFVIRDMFSIGDLFSENLDAASHIRSLTLSLTKEEYFRSEPHPWFSDRTSLMRKAFDTLSELTELYIYCSFGTWNATERGISYGANYQFQLTEDSRSIPFFAQARRLEKLKRFCLLDTTDETFSIKGFRKVGLKVVEAWMRQKLGADRRPG
jgi:hypothetical protein